MTYPQYTPPAARRKIWPVIFGGIMAGLAALCIIGSIMAACTPSKAPESAPGIGVAVGSAAADAVPSTVPTVKAPAKPTLALSTKTTKKSCFGSAGCLIEYQIVVTIKGSGKLPDSCDVTYEVRGLQDPQVGTLTLTDDGKYTQDSYQSGQTERSSSKLTVKMTDIECRG